MTESIEKQMKDIQGQLINLSNPPILAPVLMGPNIERGTPPLSWEQKVDKAKLIALHLKAELIMRAPAERFSRSLELQKELALLEEQYLKMIT